MSNKNIIKSPYNFVPLSEEVYTPSWANLISQDVPFSDGVSGKIRLRITAETPIFIRNGQKQDKEKDRNKDGQTAKQDADKKPQKFSQTPDGRFYIPATSIKGEVRNVLEIMSFGRMTVDERAKFADRKGKNKKPFNNSVFDCLPKAHKDLQSLDLAECIFGHVKDKGMLKGRVQFGHAFSDNAKEEEPVRLTLSSPKASFYPIYIKQDNNIDKYKTYDDGQLAGWKRYVIRTGVCQNKTSTGNTDTTITPLKKGSVFTCEITYHNLLPIELGALLSALTFHNTPNCFHQLGQAKPYGYGKVKYDVDLISPEDKECAFYLEQFEKKMCEFMREFNSNWLTCPEMNELIALVSRTVKPNENQFNYMDLKEFQNVKKNKNSFKPFSEIKKDACASLQAIAQQEEQKRTARESELREQKRVEEINNFKKELEERDKELCNKVETNSALQPFYIELLNKHIQECTDIREKQGNEDLKDIINKYLSKWKEERNRLEKELDEKKREEDDKKIFTDGFKQHLFDIDSIQKCFIKCDKWVRLAKKYDNRREKLNEEELGTLVQKLKELYKETSPKDKKDYNPKGGKFVKKFREVIGENNKTIELFNTITNQQ